MVVPYDSKNFQIKERNDRSLTGINIDHFQLLELTQINQSEVKLQSTLNPAKAGQVLHPLLSAGYNPAVPLH